MDNNTNNNTVMYIVAAVILLVVAGLAAFFILNQNAEDEDNSDNDTQETTNDNNNDDSTTSGLTADDTDQKPVVGESLSFDLSAQNDSGQNGTVTLVEVGDQVQVTIALSNPTLAAEPAHIHRGACPTPGAVVFPLNDVVNGASVTLLDTSFDALRAEGALAVNIHKSATESSVYYSCGDLEL